jgi:hypothetical protein
MMQAPEISSFGSVVEMKVFKAPYFTGAPDRNSRDFHCDNNH